MKPKPSMARISHRSFGFRCRESFVYRCNTRVVLRTRRRYDDLGVILDTLMSYSATEFKERT